MKKKLMTVLGLAIVLVLLAAMGILALTNWEKYPKQAADGAEWDKNWTMLGAVLGVEEPGNGFVLQDNNVALAADDTYLATWVHGEAVPFVNENGDDAESYEAQIYLLVMGCKDGESARTAADGWIARENSSYAVADTRDETHNGVEYTVLAYTPESETNPYSRGISAFAVFENYAVSVEINCMENYDGDERAVLASFLDRFHYSAEIGE